MIGRKVLEIRRTVFSRDSRIERWFSIHVRFGPR